MRSLFPALSENTTRYEAGRWAWTARKPVRTGACRDSDRHRHSVVNRCVLRLCSIYGRTCTVLVPPPITPASIRSILPSPS